MPMNEENKKKDEDAKDHYEKRMHKMSDEIGQL
jgi:hypothetical protein